MKKHKNPVIDELLVDVVEYAFIEWLVRRKVFTLFRSNYDRTPSSAKSFRGCLRGHIRYLFRHPYLGLDALVSSAFLFTSTPEGFDFWSKCSDDWRHFCASFQKKR